MKKFWIFLFIALLGGSFAGERIRILLLKGFDFFWHATQGIMDSRQTPVTEDANNIPIIGKRLNGFAPVILAAAGEDKGIKKNDRVITLDNAYVGHIERVSLHTSEIVLASHAGEHGTAWLPVLSTPVELEGWGSGLLRALVPASFFLEVGDDIWYDARLDAFVGDIISIKDMPASPVSQGGQTIKGEELKEVLVRHAVNPLMISLVRVIPP